MQSISRSTQWATRKQSGTALIVTLVLVLLATLLALFAMNVGISEQRMSGNDVRARVVHQTTEAALSQGVEYFRANRTKIDTTNTALWQLCGATDISFPCGTVEQFDTSGVLPRRSKMYRFIGGGSYDVNGNGNSSDALDMRSVPLDRLMSTVGNGYTVNYGVGALLCMVQNPVNATDPTKCTTDVAKASNTNIITVAAIGRIPGESASTTLTNAFGIQSSISNPAGKPPVVASGSIDITGGIQVVTNANAAGPGVPVSIWTRLDVQKTGTPNTCYMDDYIRNQKGNASPIYEGTTPPIITCDTCGCSDSLSYQSSGNSQQMGIDILDVDNVPVIGTAACTGGATCKSNANVRPNEFPCDMFQLVFGDQAWKDTDNDFFCETRLTASFTGPDGTVYPSIGEDEKYLYNTATKIIPISANTPKVKASQLASCNDLTSASVGLIWDQQACGIGSNKQVGTPDFPVLLVEDGSTTIQGRMFGLLFVRAPNTPLDPATGGSKDGSGGSLRMNAGAVIYGSAVIQGQVIKGNGTSAIVYNATVLGNLGKEPQLNPFSPVSASWSDRFAY